MPHQMRSTHYTNRVSPHDKVVVDAPGDRVSIELYVGTHHLSAHFHADDAQHIAVAIAKAASTAAQRELRWCPSCHVAKITRNDLVCETCRDEDGDRSGVVPS